MDLGLGSRGGDCQEQVVDGKSMDAVPINGVLIKPTPAPVGWLLAPPDQGAVLLHGRSGKLRFTLDPKPLLFQWAHLFRQFLQKRYKL